ncbi:hypothetical protein [Puniceibacterium sediminis]|uniref:Uncharacterized protein n=1 Tax=Puniceibacterium sediminis TaxID=1608407 RepID=A0A238Z1Z9_9RHOB|nr:hypothetical protein [Puniceibacterium sediminis]SNR76968.1 hypothetical protein SAMN06265370_12218 [Puniceibacterium sediminis]
MIPNDFRIAMCNSLRIGPFGTPHSAQAAGQEWLIVSRSGPEGALLQISDTGVAKSPDSDEPPADLSERNTILALLAEPDASAPQFLMVRHLPPGVQVAGTFFPADGAARLTQGEQGLGLKAFGRHAHTSGMTVGRLILHDIPDPAPSYDAAVNWHFDAEERRFAAAP